MSSLKKSILFLYFNFFLIVVVAAQPSIYSVRQGGILAKAGLDGSNLTELNNSIGQGNGVALDIAGGKVYYSDGIGGTIKRANLDGTGEETIISTADGPFGIELDLKNNRLYWISRNDGEVQYVDLATPANIMTLTAINGDFPITVIADTINNKVYWNHRGNGNNNGEIICYNLSNNTETVILGGLRFPSGMALVGDKIYWADFGNGTINRTNIDGSNTITIESGLTNPIGLAVDISNNRIYVSEQGGGQNIYSSNINDLTNDRVEILDLTDTPEHIALALSYAEISITGNGNNIADSPDCDTNPSTNNDTDFGNVLISGASDTHTFTIKNDGDLPLNLTNPSSLITIGGTNASDFTVLQPAVSSIQPNGTTTFQIEFDPVAIGLRTATVTIVNNDCSEATFCFAIQGTGVDCPDFAGVTPAKAEITESTCSVINGTPDGGVIAAPTTTNCPAGSTLQYSKDNSTFSVTVPDYNQTTSETIYTKCVCTNTNTTTSSTVSIVTTPGSCSNLLTVSNLNISDPCSCENPQNITLADGRFLFHDVLKVMTSTGLTVSIASTDNNLLDVNGTPIPVNTIFSETATGVYELDFYTLPETPSVVTVSDGISSGNFTTTDCTTCVIEIIPSLNQWGLFIYFLVIFNVGLILIRKLNHISSNYQN